MRLLVGLCALLISMPALSLDTEGRKVGLVLSGGGARGLAHVGVLRVLEAQGIRPDVITGTSMGAIVGALYASGKTPAEIDQIARSMDWQRALSDTSPRRHQPYSIRQLDAGLTTDLRLSITGDGISFPRGAIQGQHLGLILEGLFELDGQPQQIESLPITFAAVAADLESGEAVVMDRGPVSVAVRASMSIPGALQPVEAGGRLLVDGGVANNMPVDLARSLGAEVIIAVDVGAPLLTRDEMNSLFAVAQQTTGFLVRLNTLDQVATLTDDDLLITPDLAGLSSLAFDRGDDMIAAGRAAAEAAFETVAAVDDVPAEDSAVSDDPVIAFIRIRNDSPVADEVIRRKLRQPLGEPLDRRLLEEDISRLYGLDYFSQVSYRLVNEGGRHGLSLVCTARETGNTWLKLGLELADDFRGNTDVGLAASLRMAGLNRLGGTAVVRAEVGTTPELELRFLQPLDAGQRYFIEPGVGYEAEVVDIYVDQFQEEPFSSYQRYGRWAELAAGRMLFREVAEFRFGIHRERGEFDFRRGIELGIDGESYDDGYRFVGLGWDSLDDLGFPASGTRWRWRREWHDSQVGADEHFIRNHFDMSVALTRRQTTLLVEADAELANSDTFDGVALPFIGGFLDLSGLPPRSRFGRHRGLARAVLYHRLGEQGVLPIGVPLYIGLSGERGNVWLQRSEADWHHAIKAGSVFVAARTPLGPAYFSYGSTEEGDTSFGLYLGQRFR